MINKVRYLGYAIPCKHIFILHTHKICKATNRESTGSCDELQQSHPLLVVHLLNKLSADHRV